jgi:hypothetical protein
MGYRDVFWFLESESRRIKLRDGRKSLLNLRSRLTQKWRLLTKHLDSKYINFRRPGNFI